MIPQAEGKCSCYNGYHGAACENECPGGGDNPCYGKGSCDKTTGMCTCIEGADNSTSCSTCVDGWFGYDCSVCGTNRESKCYYFK